MYIYFSSSPESFGLSIFAHPSFKILENTGSVGGSFFFFFWLKHRITRMRMNILVSASIQGAGKLLKTLGISFTPWCHGFFISELLLSDCPVV